MKNPLLSLFFLFALYFPGCSFAQPPKGAKIEDNGASGMN